MGLKQKIEFVLQHPNFFFGLLKLKNDLTRLKKTGHQLWVFQCDFKGHFPYLRPYCDYSKNFPDVKIFFAIGYSKNDATRDFLKSQNIPEENILCPIDYVTLTDWDVYMSPTEWGNAFPKNSDALRVQLFHTLGDKNLEYGKELLKFNTIFANGPVHHQFLEKYLFSRYPGSKISCRVINSGYAKIDDLFDNTYSKADLKKALHIDANDNRPILLYAPNWEATSALYRYGTSVFDMLTEMKEYTVLVKLHYMSLLSREDHDATLSSENHTNRTKEWVDWLSILQSYANNENFHVIQEQNINPWLFLADLMITDYGGASLEFITMNKPIIYLNCPDFFDMRGHHIFEKEAMETGYTINDVKILEQTVKRALDQQNDQFSVKRQKMARKLVYNPGKAAATGFNTVYELVKKNKNNI